MSHRTVLCRRLQTDLCPRRTGTATGDSESNGRPVHCMHTLTPSSPRLVCLTQSMSNVPRLFSQNNTVYLNSFRESFIYLVITLMYSIEGQSVYRSIPLVLNYTLNAMNCFYLGSLECTEDVQTTSIAVCLHIYNNIAGHNVSFYITYNST